LTYIHPVKRIFIGTVLLVLSPFVYGKTSENTCRLTSDPEAVFFSKQEHPHLALPTFMSGGGTIAQWKASATAAKMPYLEFDSHNNDRRIIFLDSDLRFDRWILALAGASGSAPLKEKAETVDMILMDKGGKGAPKIYFREYNMDTGIPRRNPPERMEACYQCHMNGPREIIPEIKGYSGFIAPNANWIESMDSKSMSAKKLAASRIDQFNRRIRSYGYPDWHGAYEPERRFPPMGEALGKSDCTKCHNGEDRGILTPLSKLGEINYKITFEKSMPPSMRKSFSEKEREELLYRMHNDYQDTLNSWMKSHPPCR